MSLFAIALLNHVVSHSMINQSRPTNLIQTAGVERVLKEIVSLTGKKEATLYR